MKSKLFLALALGVTMFSATSMFATKIQSPTDRWYIDNILVDQADYCGVLEECEKRVDEDGVVTVRFSCFGDQNSSCVSIQGGTLIIYDGRDGLKKGTPTNPNKEYISTELPVRVTSDPR